MNDEPRKVLHVIWRRLFVSLVGLIGGSILGYLAASNTTFDSRIGALVVGLFFAILGLFFGERAWRMWVNCLSGF
jgi:hypothetical protein